MARYAYAPLSVEDGDGVSRRRGGGYSNNSSSGHEMNHEYNDDSLLNERMPMCVGLCVLLAIVYVLTSSHVNHPSGVVNNGNCLGLGELREKALAQTPAYILECPEDEPNCHYDQEKREAALDIKGATIWMTGCSGAGKTTIAKAVEEELLKLGKHVYRLDGDNLRTGLNRDLTFDASDRAESVRRAGEVATLMSSAGIITLVGLISPYQVDRDLVRKRHEDLHIPFYEVFLDVPLEELKARDPKGVYARAAKGEILHLTCVDDPYQRPPNPEIVLPTHNQSIQTSAKQILSQLQTDGLLQGPPLLTPPLPNPDGNEIVDLHVPPSQQPSKRAEADTLPKVLLSNIDLNWLQVIGEGWASPLRGFMREGVLLETLHFNSILADTLNTTGNLNKLSSKTDFSNFPNIPPPERISMSLPITLPITSYTKQQIGDDAKAVALVTQLGQTVAILRNPEIYENRKEEIVSRMYGVIDPGHPYIKHIYSGGDWLIGGEVELIDRIRYNDGLDAYRLTAKELLAEFQKRNADTVYAFQTRNPTHAGHAYLMKRAGEQLKAEQGYKQPILWLSPLGGWTKSDDVPLDVRVKQHEKVLEAGLSHPGGLDPSTTVMAIWPAPMVYAGPTEVQFHAKSRRSAGASYFVVGRDPAGMKGSELAVAHKNDDLYNGDHGRYVLQNAPGIAGHMNLLSFVKVMYDTRDNDMKIPDENRLEDFISISGTKMRLLARNGATPCDSSKPMPTDLISANCIPPGFMVPNGWDGVVDYYKHQDNPQWIPWSQPRITTNPPIDTTTTKHTGDLGTNSFTLTPTKVDSLWHDIPLYASGGDNIINFVTEIPMYVTAKMELQKEANQNVIRQDTNDDGSPRYYTYGTTFFNYGFVPQTWEDPSIRSTLGHAGDNDPLDVMEIGSIPLTMGSVTPCKVLGSLELIDAGETDHKIICIRTNDPMASTMTTIPTDVLSKLQDWLKRYKTTDGKPENVLASDTPTTIEQAMQIISDTHDRWKRLCNSSSTPNNNFYLSSPGCQDTLA